MEKKNGTIKASDFGKSHQDLFKSYVENHTPDKIQLLQQKTNNTLKKMIKSTRFNDEKIIRNDVKLKNTNGGEFGLIDELSEKDGIGQVKTISNSDFQSIATNKGRYQDHSELNALMHNSKVKKGYVHYVNEDNPYIQKTVKYKYDFDKYQNDLSKVKRVQSFIEKKGMGFVDTPVNNTFSTNLAKDFGDLQEMKSHSIVSTGIKTNNPFIRNMRRENRVVIEGMQHGWFGKMRKFTTAFGSSTRLGDAHNDYKNYSDNYLDKMFDNKAGIDIESLSLNSSRNSVLQIGLKYGNSHKSFFHRQAPGATLQTNAFLKDKVLGQMEKEGLLNLSQSGTVKGYGKNLTRFSGGSFTDPVHAAVMDRNALDNEVSKFIKHAKDNKIPIYGMNLRFEMNHLNTFLDNTHLDFSAEYNKKIEEARVVEKKIKRKLAQKMISEEAAFSQLVGNQGSRFRAMLDEAKKGGELVDLQEGFKYLNAISQEKGLTTRINNIGINSNVELFAKIFLGENELHESTLDNAQQAKIGKRAVGLIRDIENGKAEKNPYFKAYQQAFTTDLDDNLYNSYIKNIESAHLQGENVRDINPGIGDKKLLSSNRLSSNYERALTDYKASDRYKANLLSNGALLGEKSNLGLFEGLKSNKKIGATGMGMMLFGGALLAGAATNFFTFSGSDDDANTIEGLRHEGVAGQNRQSNTSFGSGFRTEKFHHQGNEEQDGMSFKHLAYTGMGVTGAAMVFKHQANKMRLNDLTYLGALAEGVDNETLLGRKNATGQDLFVAGARRLENAMGGIGKAFAVGDLGAFGLYDSASFTVDLTSKEGVTYAKYMDSVLKRKLIQEGVDSIMYKGGELFERIDGKYRKVAGDFKLMKTVTNYDLNKNISPLAKSALYKRGITNLSAAAKFPFLIIGGEGSGAALGDFLGSFIHDTFSKPFKLLADPVEALRQAFPDLEDGHLLNAAKKILDPKYMPDLGLDGHELVDTVPNMLKKHAGKLAFFGTAAYLGFGSLDWATQYLTPDGNPIGDAGIIGGAAFAVRKTHEAYARLSDITGLTGLRDWVEEKAPGSSGWQTTIGLTAAGASFGALYGMSTDVGEEVSSANSYKKYVENLSDTEQFDGPLSKVFKGKMTKTGKAMRLGGLAGFAAALPFTIAGFGADSSASQLGAEYSGERQVAIKKGRFWETGFTPWGGGEIDYYRPNWYAKLMDDAKNKELHGGDISPIGKVTRAISDPYWLEKRRYHDQPYPITGPDGSMMGIFGPAYEATLGRIIKPVAVMHEAVLPDELINNTEYDATALMRKQWNSTMEFIGLRGFAVKAIKENITGSGEIFADANEARSAKDIDSMVRDFYDLQIGGGILTTEALRRVFQSSDSFSKAELGASINLNPLKNNMPSWMPGDGYITNFKEGDPFMKVKDGYYRLPGKGFASRYGDELDGMDPENYPDIFKYQILSDVAYGSMEHRRVKGKLQNRELTTFEQQVFDDVQRQVDEKKESELYIRDPKTYDSMLGRYSAFLTDLARSNPLETLTPISPAHKFLGPPDVEEFMEEKLYSKDYRNWSNPIDDFALPAVSMTLNNLGLPGFHVNSSEEEAQEYMDKVEYVKYSNLAREAQAKGDLKSADQYTVLAQKTYTGKNLYSHPSSVASSLPSSQKASFNYFVGADVITRQKMLDRTSPIYKDAYQAQHDMLVRQEALNNSSLNAEQRRRVLRQIQESQSSIELKRKASLQDFKKIMPNDAWSGWAPDVSTQNVNREYVDNKARDNHNYVPKRSLRSDPAAARAAAQVPQNMEESSSYSSQYTKLNKAGVKNTLVVLRPGLDNSSTMDITVDRTEERNGLLRDWGYTK